MGERLHRRGGRDAVRGERGQRSGEGAAEEQGAEGVQPKDGGRELPVVGEDPRQIWMGHAELGGWMKWAAIFFCLEKLNDSTT